MSNDHLDRFRGRRFPEEIIVCASDGACDIASVIGIGGNDDGRGVEVDHSTIARWVLHFSQILNNLIRREMRGPNSSWVDETYVRGRTAGLPK
jgi:transposase-like protein